MATARDDVDLLTVDEVARRLRVHRTTVWKLVKTNRLQAVRLTPRITRIPRSAVESILREQVAGEFAPPSIEGERSEKPEDPLVARLRRFREALAAKRGGRPFSDSTKILRELRNNRALG